MRRIWFWWVLTFLPAVSVLGAERVVKVGDGASLRAALGGAKPGTCIRIAPGRYQPGIYVANLRGSDEAEVVITIGDDVQYRDLPGPQNAHWPLSDDFARAVLEDRPPRFAGTDGMKATRIIDAIYESSRRRTWVAVRGR